jgi:RNA-binding protein
MPLNNADKKRFRAIGHNLNPIITIAQKGLTESIKTELERALSEHELIKIKLISANRDDKNALTEEICGEFNAECIQSIGHVVLLYRAARNPDKRLSNISRNS